MSTFKLGYLHMLARATEATLAAAAVTMFLPLPLPMTLALTRRFGREDRMRRWHRMTGWARFCRRHVMHIDLSLEGREYLPRPSRGYMYVSNHQSYVDILVLMEALETVAFLSKRMILYLPFIGQAAYAGGTVFFDRSEKHSRKRALEDTLRMCRESTAVVVFAEGTRSADGRIRDEIRPGAIQAAWESGLKVVPVGLDGTFEVVPKTMDRVNLGRRVAVSIGVPLDPAAQPDKEAFVRTVWEQVRALHFACRERIT